MNWLIYIGGGLVFWIFSTSKLKGLVDYYSIEKGLKEKCGISIFLALVITLSPIMVWIWICWKFIR